MFQLYPLWQQIPNGFNHFYLTTKGYRATQIKSDIVVRPKHEHGRLYFNGISKHSVVFEGLHVFWGASVMSMAWNMSSCIFQWQGDPKLLRKYLPTF